MTFDSKSHVTIKLYSFCGTSWDSGSGQPCVWEVPCNFGTTSAKLKVGGYVYGVCEVATHACVINAIQRY